ncbi:DUF4381 domain-containing protein [Gammaproteobacteria bacterium]
MTPAMPPDPLADLRPYHLPEPVSWWPPAPGWWLLGGGLLILAAWLLRSWLRRHRRRAPMRQALAELARLRARWVQDGDEAAFVQGLSRLLRRVALQRFPQHPVAGLSGEAWLDFLDAHGGQGRFCQDANRDLLLASPYQRGGSGVGESLATLVESWITRVF